MPEVVTMVPTGRPCWSREASIGDYGGHPNKQASKTEGSVPYAWFVYRERSAMLGSAYSQQTGTLVHCQNLASARLYAWVWFRKPEQFRNDCLPGTSDQGLEYWAQALGIVTKATDQRWQVRQRCAAHYRAVTSVTLTAIQAALQELLGAAYVDASFQEGGEFSTPPDLTYWPGVNDGPASYDLGGGTWMSPRSHLFVQVTRPPAITDAAYRDLINIQAFQLLDRMLPAYATFAINDEEGFTLDVSNLDFSGVNPS